ncbi:hypothetical protein K2173_017860 [Erythroxylum novogranatense]|uniref:Uncharacterized protein n=1 Tax=Erythroxylum novogranatense TaxID=1862640 RepID=A0AAV8SLT5_9ROSI|nr:hypothetical protein K2173_017860 [Erythroxylum novogranatense]
MPRPGPRPYECVKKAWHSDRHQPMRGSIIQQIFRLVHKTHSTATKKNREWQAKLPIVVLRAEEIIYSKANSEVLNVLVVSARPFSYMSVFSFLVKSLCFNAQAEYLDLETLWDRVNDAIDTIIRRDESSETGDLLPPCVEAALNLGCFPVRASRSQRHSNVRSYLSPRVHEPVPAPSRASDKANNEICPRLPLHSSNQMNFARAAPSANPIIPALESNHHVARTSCVSSPCSYPYLYRNLPPPGLMTRETNMGQQTYMQLNSGSVYPLYYGDHHQMGAPQLTSQAPEKLNTIFVGKPVGMSVAEPAEMVVLQNFLSHSGGEVASEVATQADLSNTHEKPPGTECDLSLRLSITPNTCINMERSLAQETLGAASNSSRDKSKFIDPLPQNNEEFCFFPGRVPNQSLESCSLKLLSNGEDQYLDAAIRKRKAPFTDNLENGQFCWQSEFPFS